MKIYLKSLANRPRLHHWKIAYLCCFIYKLWFLLYSSIHKVKNSIHFTRILACFEMGINMPLGLAMQHGIWKTLQKGHQIAYGKRMESLWSTDSLRSDWKPQSLYITTFFTLACCISWIKGKNKETESSTIELAE